MEELDIRRALRSSRERDTDEPLLHFDGELLERVAGSGAFPDSVLDDVLEAIGERESLFGPRGWQVVDLLDEHWDSMNAAQRRRTIAGLVAVFGSSPQEMFNLRVAEVIAQRAEIETALEWMTASLPRSMGKAKASVVHSAEHLYDRNPESKERLIRVMRPCLADSDAVVRNEAQRLFRRLVGKA